LACPAAEGGGGGFFIGSNKCAWDGYSNAFPFECFKLD